MGAARLNENPLSRRPQIQACEGINMRPFSLFPDEAEVLFAAGAKFRVTSSQKRLEAEHLEDHASAGGSFPAATRGARLRAQGKGPRVSGTLSETRIAFGRFPGRGAPAAAVLRAGARA